MAKLRQGPAAGTAIRLAPPPLPPNASVGKRWRFRRNLVIYIAHRQGVSQRILADVFDLPRSRIGSIIAEFRQYHAEARLPDPHDEEPAEKA